MSKTCVFVLGMHRSGTSAMAGALSFLGMGFDSNLVEAVKNDNPNGYWEPVDVVNINDDIFAALNMHYMDFRSFQTGWASREAMDPIRDRISGWLAKSFSTQSLIVVKDPRLCRTLPLWVDVLEQQHIKTKYIHVFRHPMEVVNSLRVRDHTFAVVEGLLVWLAHVLGSFEFSSPRDSAIVSYGALMNDPVLVLESVGESLDLEWPMSPSSVAGSLEMFLEHSLTHQYFKGGIPYPPLNKLIQSVFDFLKNYDLKSPDKDFYSYAERFQTQLQEFSALFENTYKSYSFKLEAEKTNTAQQVAHRDALVSELRGQLEAEKTNAAQQVAHRDALVSELRGQLEAEKTNAAQQVAHRDALVSELRGQLEAEKTNAAQQVAHRDALVSELRGQLEAEKNNAAEQIGHRDALVAELNERLSSEKSNAVEQIEYRDGLLAELSQQLELSNNLLSSRKALLRLLINPAAREKV